MKRFLQFFFVAYVAAALATLVREDMFSAVMTDMVRSWLAGLALLSIVYVIALRQRRFDLVDTAWGLTFIAITAAAYTAGGNSLGVNPATLVLLLVCVWGLRLAGHIGRRFLRATKTDERYIELMKKWRGNVAVNAYLRIYVVQSLLALLVSIPVIHILILETVQWDWWIIMGLGTWMLGFITESLADRQLTAFLREPNNRGKLMNKGLWKYSRYPNYFGEITMWWGFACMAFGTPYGWVGVGGAALISYLIVYVSGIPPKEARLRTRPGWQKYVKSTRLLLPAPK